MNVEKLLTASECSSPFVEVGMEVPLGYWFPWYRLGPVLDLSLLTLAGDSASICIFLYRNIYLLSLDKM